MLVLTRKITDQSRVLPLTEVSEPERAKPHFNSGGVTMVVTITTKKTGTIRSVSGRSNSSSVVSPCKSEVVFDIRMNAIQSPRCRLVKSDQVPQHQRLMSLV